MTEDTNLTNSHYQVVMPDGSTVGVSVQSNSNITNFDFLEEARQISFDVAGGANGTSNGFATIAADKVLGAPYVVTIDGQPTTHFVMFEDTIGGENMIQISYQGGPHEITITGASVVPEFPYHMAGLLAAAAIGVVAVVSRSIRVGKNASLQ